MALPCKEHRNGRTANVQLLCRRSCGHFQKKKNDAAAVMRSWCALEKLCARSEKRLSKRGIARYGSRPHEDRYRPEHRLKDTPRYVCRTAVRGAAVGETSQREALSERDSEKADTPTIRAGSENRCGDCGQINSDKRTI